MADEDEELSAAIDKGDANAAAALLLNKTGPPAYASFVDMCISRGKIEFGFNTLLAVAGTSGDSADNSRPSVSEMLILLRKIQVLPTEPKRTLQWIDDEGGKVLSLCPPFLLDVMEHSVRLLLNVSFVARQRQELRLLDDEVFGATGLMTEEEAREDLAQREGVKEKYEGDAKRAFATVLSCVSELRKKIAEYGAREEDLVGAIANASANMGTGTPGEGESTPSSADIEMNKVKASFARWDKELDCLEKDLSSVGTARRRTSQDEVEFGD
ncbi:unnamed protein product [Amoebophrya sp. A25]|nr:unnamed protein product [Amoebophrya sp. A25]|eukprot:GSA25T00019360001.1